MDKLGDMDLFVRVVKNGGLAAAGREVGLSPASMTARINALEARYNTRFLSRSTRHVSVTERGQHFYEACLNILASMNDIEAQISGDQKILTGPLRVTASSDLGHQHIMPVISKFIDDNPEVQPYLHLSDGIVNITQDGFDCAIRYGDLPDSSLVARKLASSHRVLCASPSYLKRRGYPKTPQDLVEHDCLATIRGSEPMTSWFFNGVKGLESISVKGVRSSNDGTLTRRWAVEGAGIALKSYYEVIDDIKSGRLELVLEEFMPDFIRNNSSSADLHIVYPSRQYLPTRVKVFIKYLSEYFQELEKNRNINIQR